MKLDCLQSQITMALDGDSGISQNMRPSPESARPTSEEIHPSAFMQLFAAVITCFHLPEIAVSGQAPDVSPPLASGVENPPTKPATIFDSLPIRLAGNQPTAIFSPALNPVIIAGAPDAQEYFGHPVSEGALKNNLTPLPSSSTAANIAPEQPSQLETVPLSSLHEKPIPGKIIYGVKNGVPEMEIQLDPPDLGKLKIQIATDQQRLLLRITVDTPQAKDMITNNLQHLKAELIASGFEIDTLDIALSDYSLRRRFDQERPSSSDQARSNLEPDSADSPLALAAAGVELLPRFGRIDFFA